MRDLLINLYVMWIMFKADRARRKYYKSLDNDLKKAGLQ